MCHKFSEYVQPTTYKPAFVSSTSRPFSLVIGDTDKPFQNKYPYKNEDEEVFYIFYENNEKPLVSKQYVCTYYATKTCFTGTHPNWH